MTSDTILHPPAAVQSAASTVRDGVIVPTFPEGSTLRLTSRQDVAEGVVKLTLEDHHGRRLAPWTPGSHIDLILPNGLVRQYSLCGDRYDAFKYEVAVLREPNSRGGSAWIHDHAQPGASFDFGGPRNLFPLVPAEQYLFIAGGIGITPLLPMIEQVAGSGASWKMLYGGRARRSMAFADGLVQRFGNAVEVFPQDEFGFPDIPGWLGSYAKGTRVYVCGPGGLLDAVARACESWPSYARHSERFVAASNSDAENHPFEVELARSGTVLQVSSRQTVLEVLSQAGKTVLSSCRQGTCGTCEIRVLAGVPDHRDSVLSDDDRRAGDCLMTCVSRAAGQRIVLDL